MTTISIPPISLLFSSTSAESPLFEQDSLSEYSEARRRWRVRLPARAGMSSEMRPTPEETRLRSSTQDILLDVAGWLLPAALMALPISTSAAEILFWAWLATAAAGLGVDRLAAELRRPAGVVSMGLFALGLIGLTWTVAPWKEALGQLNALFQFLSIPVLIAQMRARPVSLRLITAILVVTAFVWLLSISMLVFPTVWSPTEHVGVPLKNYSVQSIVFTLVAFGLFHGGVVLWGDRRAAAIACVAGALLLIGNVLFVMSSRTIMLALIPLTILVFMQLYGWRGAAIGLAVTAIAASVLWSASPRVRERVTSISEEIDKAELRNEPTSAGLRLVYWQKALGFVAERPFFGHGTGATRQLYREAATGTGLTADVPGDPHNQVLAFAIPFGALGVVALVALFAVHLWLFRGSGPVPFMGQMIVVLFIILGLFNSHLLTFTERKIYIFGVGILAGLIAAMRARPPQRAVWPPPA